MREMVYTHFPIYYITTLLHVCVCRIIIRLRVCNILTQSIHERKRTNLITFLRLILISCRIGLSNFSFEKNIIIIRELRAYYFSVVMVSSLMNIIFSVYLWMCMCLWVFKFMFIYILYFFYFIAHITRSIFTQKSYLSLFF